MGTTQEKFEYAFEAKDLIKQGINNLGGSITDQTELKDYADELQNIYDVLPKTSFQEGTEVTLENCLKGKLDYENGVVGIGQSSQDTTQGKQLFNPYAEYIKRADTTSLTAYIDKIVVVNSNTSGNGGVGFNIPITPNTTCKISYESIETTSAQGTNTTIRYGLGTTPITTIPTMEAGALVDPTTKNVTINSGGRTYLYVYLRVDTNATGTFHKIMVSTDTSATWEKYTGGQASPNPSYPQEIKYVRGRQLFNKSTITHQILNENGIATDTQDGYFTSDFIEIDRTKQYTKTASGSIRVKLYDSSKNAISTSSFSDIANFSNAQTFSIPYSNARYIRFTMNGDYINSIMFEEGSTSTPYLPYNTIEETISGKNLWGLGTRVNGYCGIFNGGVWADTSDTTSSFYFETSKLPNQVTFKIDNGNRANVSYYNTLPMGTTNVANSYEATAYNTLPRTINVNKQYKYVFIQVAYGVDKDLLVNGQMESGDTLGTYEPYITPTTYQLSLGDKELFDECTIVGSPDNWKYVDNYYKEKFSDTTIERAQTNTTGKYRFKITPTQQAKGTSSTSEVADILSNIAIKESANATYSCENGIAIATTGNIFMYQDDFSAYNSQQMIDYFENRDDYIVYPLATPIETPITDETLITQLNAWYNAHSLNGTTIITSNGNLPMIIKVRALKST